MSPYPNFKNIARVGVPISNFVPKCQRNIFHILCASRLVTGKPSGFILITMRRLFLKEFLDLPNNAPNGLIMGKSRFRKKNCCRELLF